MVETRGNGMMETYFSFSRCVPLEASRFGLDVVVGLLQVEVTVD